MWTIWKSAPPQDILSHGKVISKRCRLHDEDHKRHLYCMKLTSPPCPFTGEWRQWAVTSIKIMRQPTYDLSWTVSLLEQRDYQVTGWGDFENVFIESAFLIMPYTLLEITSPMWYYTTWVLRFLKCIHRFLVSFSPRDVYILEIALLVCLRVVQL